MILHSLILCYLLLLISLFLAADYFNPNATSIKLQNGFERVYIQPFGNHAFRIRVSLLRDPTGHEPSALLDAPLERPSSKGLEHSITLPFQGTALARNGNLIVNVTRGVISFSRVEPNGTSTLLTGEYVDTKVLPARDYVQNIRGQAFRA